MVINAFIMIWFWNITFHFQVDVDASSLNSGDAFVLIHGDESYLWIGKVCVQDIWDPSHSLPSSIAPASLSLSLS